MAESAERSLRPRAGQGTSLRPGAGQGARAAPQRCPEHGIVLAPDGSCTLCRRPKTATVLHAEEPRPSRIANLLLALCIFASIGFGVQWAQDPDSFPLNRWLGPPRIAAPPASPSIAPEPATPPASEGELAARRRTEEPAEPGASDPSQRPEDSTQPAKRGPDPRERADVPEGEREAARRAAAEEEEARRDAERKAMIEADIERRKLQRARDGVSVVMYSTQWCGYCRRARDYMRSESIAYVEHDVDQDVSASARHRKLNPRGSVPTFDIDGQTVIGFDAAHISRVVDAAVARRAGR